jgi:MSHA biogenesis protein MshI
MKWPWTKQRADARLVIGSGADRIAWLQADAEGRLQRAGVLPCAGDAADAARQLRALGLPTHDVTAVLALDEAQLLQIDAPAVKPEELKAAARWRVKDLVDGHIDDLTLDVLTVGDDPSRPNAQMFVVAARNELIRELTSRSQARGLTLSVVDVAEMAQRNLLSALVEAAGLGQRAAAALVRHGRHCLLTVCAGGELYFARRLDWDDAELREAAPALAATAPADFETLDFIDYGAEQAGPTDPGAPRLVIELQRSFDVWERTWPNLPLAGLWVDAGEATDALVERVSQAVALRVTPIDVEPLFPGFAAAAPTPPERAALLPLLGALRRHETRKL